MHYAQWEKSSNFRYGWNINRFHVDLAGSRPYFLKKYHLTPPSGFAKALEGKSYTETAQYFLDVFPTLSCTLEEVQQEWIDMTLHLYQTKVALKPGAKEFLKYLKREQILMGIATSNAKELALAALDALQIREYFSSVRTGCEVKKGKPAPDVYLKVAEDLAVLPENFLYLKMFQKESKPDAMQG